MAITDENTVLILGAGVSAPFGIPLGGQFIDLIATAIETEGMLLEKDRDLHAAVFDPPAFWKYPVHGPVLRPFIQQDGTILDPGGLQNERERLRQLGGLLKHQTAETIDDFIVENPSVADITKVAVAALILRQCYDCATLPCTPIQFGTRDFWAAIGAGQSVQRRNWVHLLINLARHGIRREAVSPENKIRIVTFNYDTILEHILEGQFPNSERRRPHWGEFIEIVHVHGQFARLRTISSPAEVAREWAGGIHVVNEENPPAAVAANRARARELIQSCKELYAAGFAFAGPNCKLLGLEERGQGNGILVNYCNYDGNAGVRATVGKLFPHQVVSEAPVLPSGVLSVENWIRAGYLGELPG